MRLDVPRGVVGLWFATVAAWAFANAPLGSKIENIEMPMLGGGTHPYRPPSRQMKRGWQRLISSMHRSKASWSLVTPHRRSMSTK